MTTVLACLFLLFASAAATGHSVAESMELPEAQAEVLGDVYRYAIATLPATLFVMAIIVTYFEYIIIAKILNGSAARKAGAGADDGFSALAPIPQMPKISRFTLPPSALTGCLVVILLSWGLSGTDTFNGLALNGNVNIVFEFIFCIQGISVLFFLGESKRVSKPVIAVTSVILLGLSLGQTLLFLLGIFDLIFGVKDRRIRFRG